MSFTSTLASLLVNVTVNSSGASAQLNTIHGQVTRGVRDFYLWRTAIITALQSVKQLVDSASKLEYEFAKINRVFNITGKNADSFRQSVVRAAKDLKGIGLGEFSESVRLAAQAGFKEEEALAFAKVGSKLALLSDMSPQAATDYLTKILVEFNEGSKSAESFALHLSLVADAATTSIESLINVTERVGGLAYAIGLTKEDLVVLAATLKDAGVRTEVAGSSIIRFITLVQQDADKIADAFEWSDKQYVDFLKTLDTKPSDAIIIFFKELGKLASENKQAAIEALDVMNIQEARIMASAFAGASTMAGHYQNLLDRVNAKKREGITLDQQTAFQQNTLKASITDLHEAWERLALSLADDLKTVVDLLQQVTNLLEQINKLGITAGDIIGGAIAWKLGGAAFGKKVPAGKGAKAAGGAGGAAAAGGTTGGPWGAIAGLALYFGYSALEKRNLLPWQEPEHKGGEVAAALRNNLIKENWWGGNDGKSDEITESNIKAFRNRLRSVLEGLRARKAELLDKNGGFNPSTWEDINSRYERLRKGEGSSVENKQLAELTKINARMQAVEGELQKLNRKEGGMLP